MRILIVSDTHGYNENYEKVINREAPFDRVLHLGDAQGSHYFLSQIAGCPFDIVEGNCDSFMAQLPREMEIDIVGNKILIAHGHHYYVKSGKDRIRNAAISRGFDVVMYGHSHIPSVDVEEQVILVNPGSLSFPRQDGMLPSYIIMDVDENGEMDFTIKYLESFR